MKAAGPEDGEERGTRPEQGRHASGGEGHIGQSRDLWVMNSTEARLMRSLFPDGNMIGRIHHYRDVLGDSQRLKRRA